MFWDRGGNESYDRRGTVGLVGNNGTCKKKLQERRMTVQPLTGP